MTKTLSVLLALILMLTSSTTVFSHTLIQSEACKTGESVWLATRLFFGLNYPGGEVSELQWKDFQDTQISPMFPDGITVMDGKGIWKDPKTQNTTTERSKILFVVHKPTEKAHNSITMIIASYKETFNQQSVLKVVTTACIKFPDYPVSSALIKG